MRFRKRDFGSIEIQRSRGRSVRAVTHLQALESHTLWIDCNVLQEDGGTRTASISEAYTQPMGCPPPSARRQNKNKSFDQRYCSSQRRYLR
jgi:hypothetical protein